MNFVLEIRCLLPDSPGSGDARSTRAAASPVTPAERIHVYRLAMLPEEFSLRCPRLRCARSLPLAPHDDRATARVTAHAAQLIYLAAEAYRRGILV